MTNGVASAATDYSDKDESTRRIGVAWNMASDRRVENIAGIVEPEGLDKYMKRYFDQINSKLDAMANNLADLSKQVKEIGLLVEKIEKKDSK